MHIMRELLRIARFEKLKSYSAFFPTVYADFGYSANRLDANYREFHTRHSSYTQNGMDYAIRADYLLFNGFARYNTMREKQTLYAVAEYNMAETYLTVINDVRAAYSNCTTAFRQLKIYRDLLGEALRQRNLVMERYCRYRASVDRMDKVQQYYVDIQTQFAASVTQFRKAVAQLEAILMVDVYRF